METESMAGEAAPPILDFAPTKLTDLISEELLEMIQLGYAKNTMFPLTILEKRGDTYARLPAKEVGENWVPYCSYIRGTTEGNDFCCKCDERVAAEMISRNESKPKWYICDGGLVDFAIPISINNKTLAVFFGGQKRLEGTEKALELKAEELDKIFPHVKKMKLLDKAKAIKESSPSEIKKLMKNAQDVVTNNIRAVAEQSYHEKNRHWEQVQSARLLADITSYFHTDPSISVQAFQTSSRDALERVRQATGLQSCCFLSQRLYGDEEFTLVASSPSHSTAPAVRSVPMQPSLLSTKAGIAKMDIHSNATIAGILSSIGDLSKTRSVYSLCLDLYEKATCIFLFSVAKSEDVRDDDPVQRHSNTLVSVGQQFAYHANRLLFSLGREGLLRETGHLLRGPMNAIIGEAEYLRTNIETLVSEEIADCCEKVCVFVDSMKKLVETLSLQMTSDVGKHEYRFEKHPYPVLVRKLLRQFHDAALARNVSFKSEIDVPSAKESFPFDWVTMDIALTNLFDNAIKYSYSHEDIRVRVEMEGNYCKTTIMNRGTGFNEDEKNDLFKEYYRSRRKDPKRFIAGTGIGLYVAQKIIKNHGGGIEIDCRDIYRRHDNTLALSEITTILRISTSLEEETKWL